MGYIYCISCETNNKIYIGSTTRSPSKRKSEHFYKLRKGIHPNKHLQNSWDKYGNDSFSFEVIEECKKEECFNREKHYVEKTKCYKKDLGFNKSNIVDAPNRGRVMSEEQKLKISKSLKGRPSPMKGRKSKASKENIKKANKAQWRKVLNITENKVYRNVKEFCESVNISGPTFYKYIKVGSYKNIEFKYYEGF